MSEDNLVVDEGTAVLRVRLNRPEKRNALSRVLLNSIREIFGDYARNNTLRAAVIIGEGTESFAAGGDLKDLSTVRTDSETRRMSEDGRAALDAIRNFPVPVIAALNGDALGGGAELAVSCDFRVADRHARIGFLQSRLCITPAWGGGGDLVDLVGSSRAMRLLCTANILEPSEALSLGLYDDVVDDESTLADTVENFLAPIIEKESEVLRAIKATTVQARRWHDRSEFERNATNAFVRVWTHPDHWAAADKVLKRFNKGT